MLYVAHLPYHDPYTHRVWEDRAEQHRVQKPKHKQASQGRIKQRTQVPIAAMNNTESNIKLKSSRNQLNINFSH